MRNEPSCPRPFRLERRIRRPPTRRSLGSLRLLCLFQTPVHESTPTAWQLGLTSKSCHTLKLSASQKQVYRPLQPVNSTKIQRCSDPKCSGPECRQQRQHSGDEEEEVQTCFRQFLRFNLGLVPQTVLRDADTELGSRCC